MGAELARLEVARAQVCLPVSQQVRKGQRDGLHCFLCIGCGSTLLGHFSKRPERILVKTLALPGPGSAGCGLGLSVMSAVISCSGGEFGGLRICPWPGRLEGSRRAEDIRFMIDLGDHLQPNR